MEHLIVILLLQFGIVLGDYRPQRFRIQPADVIVLEGSDIVLPCEIDDLYGKVQWTRDGMALGYDESLPGYPRYKMIVDKAKGIFNLQIRNVSLDDDAEFECQVGPYRNAGIKKEPIRSAAKVNVTSRPTSIEMTGHGNNTKVGILQDDELKLECWVRKSKPPARVLWYRGGSQLKSENSDTEVRNCKSRNVSASVVECDVVSTLTIRASAGEEGAIYSCVAKHESLPNRFSLFTSIQLNVQFPPNPPIIEGYNEAESLPEGQEVRLTCRSSGGNPLPGLIWSKNGVIIPTNYKTQGKLSTNVLTFTVHADDNGAVYACEASNVATRSPLRAELNLTVYFGPKSISVSGAKEGKALETLSVTCTTTSSNPAAIVQWIVDGQMMSNHTSQNSPGSNGGLITTSVLGILVPNGRKDMVVYCYGKNPHLSRNAVGNRTISIYYPPGPPVISGYVKGGHLSSGSYQNMSCTSSGGNPLATLTWYKNNKKITSVTKRADQTSSFADITIFANKTDNGATYKCEAINPTINEPLIDTVKVQVYFPPENISIKIEPTVLRAGAMARLHCSATSSNPEAEILWLWNGIPTTDGVNSSSMMGLYGGRIAFSDLSLNLTGGMNDNTFTCQATNTVLQESVNVDAKLNVLYKPIFGDSNNLQHTGTEGDSFTFTMEVHANPSIITYQWSKNDILMSNYVNGPTLTIPKLSRNDAGIYTCEAINSEGSDFKTFQLTIKYAAKIESVTKSVTVANDSTAEIMCKVSGNPVAPYHVWWVGPSDPADLDKKSRTTFENNTSTLIINHVTIRDMGRYYCVVNNGIGTQTNKSAFLIVEHAPIIDTSSQSLKVASGVGGTVTFTCKGSGAPQLHFIWFKGNSTLNKGPKYLIDNKQADDLNYTSELSIKDVQLLDFGAYTCNVYNKLGKSLQQYSLLIKSKPDIPSNLQLLNVTQYSFTLSWTLDFNGGEKTRFEVRARAQNMNTVKIDDVSDTTVYTMKGLRSGTTYVVDVKAINILGSSDYSATKINVTTMVVDYKPSVESLVESEGFILLVVIVVGLLLLMLNVFVVLLCLKWKSKKRKGTGNDKSGTIEMYGPNTRTSSKEGTLSSLDSEKLVDFRMPNGKQNTMNERHDDISIPYIIEDINYPFIEDTYGLQRRHSSKEHLTNKIYSTPIQGYSTLNRLQVKSDCAPYGLDVAYMQPTTMPNTRCRTSQYNPDSESPTPSIPPPMTAISTHPYHNLQYDYTNF